MPLPKEERIRERKECRGDNEEKQVKGYVLTLEYTQNTRIFKKKR